MRLRYRLALAAAVAALPFLPLPGGCDPRGHEVAGERYRELQGFAGTRARAEIEADLGLVDPEGRLRPYFTFGAGGFEVRRQAGDRRPAAVIPLRAEGDAGPAPLRPLRRIALDPGHFGGAWSRLEKRHVTRAGGVAVREGDLAWATARLVERDLRAAGAETRLLRGPPPEGAYPGQANPAFDPVREASYRLAEQHPETGAWLTVWRALRLWWARRRLLRETPFELYVRHDLRRRAAAAAAFAPDLTLSIHYDYTEADDNGVLVFMPGNAIGGDLASPSQRFWAFRRVLDGTLAEARALASRSAPPSPAGWTCRSWRPSTTRRPGRSGGRSIPRAGSTPATSRSCAARPGWCCCWKAHA